MVPRDMALRVSKCRRATSLQSSALQRLTPGLLGWVKFSSGTTESLQIISLGILLRPGLKDLFSPHYPVGSDSESSITGRNCRLIALTYCQIPTSSLGNLSKSINTPFSAIGARAGLSSWLKALCFHLTIPLLVVLISFLSHLSRRGDGLPKQHRCPLTPFVYLFCIRS